jgi:hypothetical protein
LHHQRVCRCAGDADAGHPGDERAFQQMTAAEKSIARRQIAWLGLAFRLAM